MTSGRPTIWSWLGSQNWGCLDTCLGRIGSLLIELLWVNALMWLKQLASRLPNLRDKVHWV